MVILSSATRLGSGNSQHYAVSDHPLISLPQGNPSSPPPPPPATDQSQILIPGPWGDLVHGAHPPWCYRTVNPHTVISASNEWKNGYADTRGACRPDRLPVTGRGPDKPPNPDLQVIYSPPNCGCPPRRIWHNGWGVPAPGPHHCA